jgi:hypothetical protein
MIKPGDRERILTQTRNLKMARSAHAYVRGSTVSFYEWLESSRRADNSRAGRSPTGQLSARPARLVCDILRHIAAGMIV